MGGVFDMIGSLFDPKHGADWTASGVPAQGVGLANGLDLLSPMSSIVKGGNPAQLAQAYQQAQGGIGQQQAFANAVAAQGGLGNQANVFGQQQALANQLGQQALGGGPNPALAQLAQTTGQNARMQAALMGSQRGSGANVGMLGRQIAQQGANVQQQAAGQAATMRAQQQLAAQQQLQQQQQAMAGLSTQQVGQQQGALGQLAQQQMAQQGFQVQQQMQQEDIANQQRQQLEALRQQAIANQNQANVAMQSNINSANAGIAQGNQKAQAGLIGGLLGAAGTAMTGASSGAAAGGGGGAAGGAGAAALYQGGEAGYESGGQVKPDFGKSFTDAWNSSMSGVNENPIQTGMQKFSTPFMKQLRDQFTPSPSPTPQQQASTIMNSPMATAPQPMMQNQGGQIDYRRGGHVPGKAAMKGDHPQNDTVDAVLSPGEIVLPRSVSQAPDAANRAREFVETIKGHAQRFVEGGEAQPADQNQPNINIVNNPAPEPQGQPPLQPGALFAGPGAAPNSTPAPQPAPAIPTATNATPAMPPAPMGPMNPRLSQTVGQPTEGAQGIGGKPLNSVGVIGQSFEEQQKAAQAQAAAIGQQGNLEFKAKEQEQQKLQDVATDYQNKIKKVQGDYDAAMTAYKDGKINPNHVFENMSTAGRVGTAIGLILGGMGGGITGGPNPAMEFLNKQIERDVDAQRANMDKQKNIMSTAMQMFNDLGTATQFATAAQKGIYAAQFEQAGAAAKSPIAKSIAMDKAAQLKREAAMMMPQVALKQQGMNEAFNAAPITGTPEQKQEAMFKNAAVKIKYNPMLTETEREKSLDDLDKQQNLNSMQTHVVNNFDDISKLQNTGAFAKDPVQSRKQIDALWNPMLDRLTTQFAGMFSESAMKNIEHLKPKISDSPDTLELKRKQFLAIFHQNRSSARLNVAGIHIPQSVGTYSPSTKTLSNYKTSGQHKRLGEL